MKSLIVLSILLFVSNMITSAKKIDGDISPVFDISPDGKSLVLSISKGKESYLYIYSFDEKMLEKLTGRKGTYHSRPMFSPDGKKVVFRNKDLEKQKSQIAILDLESRTIQEIKTTISFVTEAVFHPNGGQIIYCASKFIGSYSPLARKAPHDIDIYSINMDGSNESKITDFNAYELSSISINNEGEMIVFEATKKDKLTGIYMMSLSDTSKIEKIEANNNPRPQVGAGFYGSPYYSRDNSTISFIAPYQVYILDLKSNECKIAWDNTKDDVMIMAIHSRFLISDKRIIISGLKIINRQYTSNAILMAVNFDNGEIEELKIK